MFYECLTYFDAVNFSVGLIKFIKKKKPVRKEDSEK